MPWWLIPALATAAGVVGERSAQKKAQGKQKSAIGDWIDYQEAAKDETLASDTEYRDANYGALDGFLSGADQGSREAFIAGDSDRLFAGSTTPGFSFLPQMTFSSPEFRDYAGTALAKATEEAQAAIRAQSDMRAFGNSSGARMDAAQEAGADIGFNNEMRGIDLSTLQKKQQVQPIQYQYQSTGLGSLLTSLGTSALGSGIADAVATPTTATTGSAWTPGMAPTATSTRPWYSNLSSIF